MRSLAWLIVVTSGTAACGSLAADEPRGAVGDPPVAQVQKMAVCARGTNAPLTNLDDVRQYSATLNACGDLAFEKLDGSTWLRMASTGELVPLAPAGTPGAPAFDGSGSYVRFTRDDRSLVRQLDTGVETELPAPAHFGFDAATGTPIVYTCAGDGIRVLRDRGLGPTIPGTEGLGCEREAPAGSHMIANGAADAVSVVDLVRGTAKRLEIDYRGSGTLGGGKRRGDKLMLSSDGNIVLHAIVTYTPCGDTECPSGDGYDILLAATGAKTQHVGSSYIGIESIYQDKVKGHSLVGFGSGGAESIDTLTGVHVTRSDASVVAVQDDGTLVLSRTDASGTHLSFGPPGPGEETSFVGSAARNADFVTFPTGKRAVVVEATNQVKAPGGSNWAGSEYGPLIVRDEAGAEVGRETNFNSISASYFASGGSVILGATRYSGPPPVNAAGSGDFAVALTSSLVRVGADGAVSVLLDTPNPTTIVALDDRSFATLVGDGTTSKVNIHDIGSAQPRRTIEGSHLGPIAGVDAPPTNVLALQDDAGNSDAPIKLWHGVLGR